MYEYKTLIIELRDRTAIISINREDKLNALNINVLTDLSSVLNDLVIDESVKGVVITGVGVKAFAAGADITEFVGLSATEASLLAHKGQVGVMNKLSSYPKPVIAALNGFALGGGLELAMSCHLRVAVTQARLGLPEVSLGIIPGYGGTQRLCELVGRGKALEMIMTADMIDGEEALRLGLVNHVVPSEDLIGTCVNLLEKIYTRSSRAIAFAIQAVDEGLINRANGYKKEIALFGESFETLDALEGIQAFIEKRKPNF